MGGPACGWELARYTKRLPVRRWRLNSVFNAWRISKTQQQRGRGREWKRRWKQFSMWAISIRTWSRWLFILLHSIWNAVWSKMSCLMSVLGCQSGCLKMTENNVYMLISCKDVINKFDHLQPFKFAWCHFSIYWGHSLIWPQCLRGVDMFTPTNNMEAFLCKQLKVIKNHVHIFCCLVQI